MNWDQISAFVIPPLLGAIIGYCTNLIAVKMLFLPHEPKYLFGKQLPFTPGAIPKGKARLAKSAGMIVQDQLFTREDISGKLLTEEVERPLIDKVMDILDRDIKESGSVMIGSEERYDSFEESLIELLTLKISEAIRSMDLPKTLKAEGTRLINEQVAESTLLSIMVSDRLIERTMNKVSDAMEEFLDGRGKEMIGEITASRIHDLGERSPLHVLNQAGYDRDVVRDKITTAYRESVVNAVNSALKRIDVASVVENKINSMPVSELEKNVLQVMKTELDMIVNLGALIGLVIGSINIFI